MLYDGTFTGNFLVVDDLPSSITQNFSSNTTLYTTHTMNVLGEAEYISVKNDNTDTLTIDGQDVTATGTFTYMRYHTSGTDPAGTGGGGPITLGMEDGQNITHSNNDEGIQPFTGLGINQTSAHTQIAYFALADGRYLISLGNEETVASDGTVQETNISMFDEVSENGSGVSTITLSNTYTFARSASTPHVQSDYYLTTEPSGTVDSAPCFTAGTLLETANGPTPVETLQVGDMISTKDHGFQPVQWVGESRVHDAAVRIKAGTFGNARDLVVSPRHRMLLKGWQMGLLFNHDEAFACAKDMQNGTTITQEPEGWVEYFHVLLDRHEVIYAEGAETESFFPDEASLNSMDKKTQEELAQTVDLSTFGRTVRPTLSANQAMYLSHNMDLLEDEQGQIAAE